MLLDRFVDSSLAYQGGGRELGVDAVRAINEFATGGLAPDRTLLLTLDPRLGRARSRARRSRPTGSSASATTSSTGSPTAYRELAAADPERIRTIDATQPPEEVLAAALGRARRPAADRRL